MEKADPSRADQPEASTTEPRDGRLSLWGVVLVWAGRALVLLTLAAVVASRLTYPSWAAEGWDSKGEPRSWLPNATLGLVLVAALCGQWLCGLAAPPSAAWREGDDLIATTVVGRRRIRVPGARVVRFRVPGRGGPTHGVFLIRGLRVLILLGSSSDGIRSQIDRLVGQRVPDTLGRVGIEYLLGFLWLLLTSAVVLVLLGLTTWWIGMFRS